MIKPIISGRLSAGLRWLTLGLMVTCAPVHARWENVGLYTAGIYYVDTASVVRAVTDPDNVDAEFAIVVRSDLKAQGLGAILMDKMIKYLKSRGTRRMVALVLPDNRAMLELGQSAGMVVDKAGSDADAVHLVLKLAE